MATKKSKLATLKTIQTQLSVEEFLNNIEDLNKKEDSFILLNLFKEITKDEPILWSNSSIGFGIKRFKSERTGREVDWFKIGFSPRKANFSLHLIIDMNKNAHKLEQLGKYKTGVGCLYINKLDDVDLNVLKDLIQFSFEKH